MTVRGAVGGCVAIIVIVPMTYRHPRASLRPPPLTPTTNPLSGNNSSPTRGETSVKTAVERREASAPEADGPCKRIFRGARRARSANGWQQPLAWRGQFSVCAFRRSASPHLFGGETSVAFVLRTRSRTDRGARTISFTSLPGEGRAPKGRGVGCAAMRGFAASCASAFTPSRRASP